MMKKNIQKTQQLYDTSLQDKIFDTVNTIFLLVLLIAMVYPFWYVLMYSISDAKLASVGGAFFWPKGFSLDSYMAVYHNQSVLSGFKVSLIVTIVGSLAGTFFTATTAYPLAKARLRGKSFLSFFVLFTMLFSGGMVPTFLLVKGLGLLDSLGALILPGLVHAWNVLVMRSFFRTLPESLEDAAKIDGASDLHIFFRIVLPLSKPVLATIALFLAVGYWNDFFSSILYITTKSRWSLQAVLREIITTTQTAMQMVGVDIQGSTSISTISVRMATIMVSTVPILLVYPFIQKYFVKGALIGSIKG